MSPEQAIEYALSAEEPSLPAATRSHEAPVQPPAILTPRQREVATLVGRGRTNAQISDALAISKNTVANHVVRITTKLNLPSRSLLAVWVTEKRLLDQTKKSLGESPEYKP